MKLTFLGAAGTVTGSKSLLEIEGYKILIDCGLFQGDEGLKSRNFKKLDVPPSEIDAVILTHAHLDHSGYVPVLVKEGFSGTIYCTEGTYDLCSIMLPDSGAIHEHDNEDDEENEPLYTREDAEASLKSFRVIEFGKETKLENGASIKFHHAGHIFGASFLEINTGDKRILFSGDLGRPEDILMNPPVNIESVDYLIIESTYGDRIHKKTSPIEQLGNIISETYAKGGKLVVPAFAVGRTQAILYYLFLLDQKNQLPKIPIYLDSPMAIKVTNLLHKYSHEHKINPLLCDRVVNIAKHTRTPEESMEINKSYDPAIIICGSGMLTGGRVLHHLKRYIAVHENTVLLTGYQAEQTLGREIYEGAETIKIHDEVIRVNARIEMLENVSAHADYQEILNWLENFKKNPVKTFVTHGRPESSTSLKSKIEEKYGWDVIVPEYKERFEL